MNLQLVQLEENLFENFKNWFSSKMESINLIRKFREWKQNLKKLKEEFENIFKKYPSLKKKYQKEYEAWEKEAKKYIEAKEVSGTDLGWLPQLIIAGAIVSGIGILTIINKMIDTHQKGLELKQKILNDPSLTFSQKKELLEAAEGKKETKSDGFGSLVWLFALAIIFVIIFVGISFWRQHAISRA
jgi:hypothetical protein